MYIIIVIVLIIFLSFFIHEGVHYIQYKLDPRAEPIGFTIDTKGMYTIATVQKNEYQQELDNETLFREIPAYAIQNLFIISSLYLLSRFGLLEQ